LPYFIFHYFLFKSSQLSNKADKRAGKRNRHQSGSGNGGIIGLAGSLRVARLGHPARVSPATQPYCLDSLVSRDEGSEIVADVRKDIDKLQRELSKRGRRVDRGQRREMQAEMRVLRKEVRKREEAVVKGILKSRQVGGQDSEQPIKSQLNYYWASQQCNDTSCWKLQWEKCCWKLNKNCSALNFHSLYIFIIIVMGITS
jgi:hypothetical protein